MSGRPITVTRKKENEMLCIASHSGFLSPVDLLKFVAALLETFKCWTCNGFGQSDFRRCKRLNDIVVFFTLSLRKDRLHQRGQKILLCPQKLH